MTIEFINKLFQCDNLDLLRRLPSECIDLIYCDILYNTGKRFKDYNDILGNPIEAIEWYHPRIEEMKRVLKDTGSIYIQCDWHLAHYIKVLLDDIFGYSNFVNEIIWGYTRPSHSKQKSFTRLHDNIFIYARSKGRHTFNSDDVRIPYSEETKKRNNRAGGSSKYTNGTGERQYNANGKIPESYWLIPMIQGNSKERTGYYSQKPVTLLERIVKASSNEGDVVADFFCGSGTTIEVAKKLGRKYIGCDINSEAIKITKSRIVFLLKD